MIAASTSAGALTALPERTWKLLQGIGVCTAPIAPEFSELHERRSNLSAAAGSWQIGRDGRACAECRMLRVHGAAEQLAYAFICPMRPHRLPAFVALLSWQSDGICQAYVDLPAPGMAAPLRDEVSELTAALAIRHAAFLGPPTSVPVWNGALSPGGLFVHQRGGRTLRERILQAYEDYLNVWIDSAAALPDRIRNDVDAQRELLRYKRRLESLLLGKEVFYRHSGEARTSRFLSEFLCR